MRVGIFHGRTAARTLARDLNETRFGVALHPSPQAALLDAARASQVARRHVEWVRREAAKAETENPLKTALTATEWRAEQVAATETFSAANEELLRTAQVVQRETGILLLKEWNAEYDACPICSDADGEQVPVSAAFSIGADPGSAHPQCRCWTEIIEAALAA